MIFTQNIYFLKTFLILLTFNLGFTLLNAQKLDLNANKWKSSSFFGYGNTIGSEIYPENTEDPSGNFEFLIEFDELNFTSSNLTLEQSDVKQILGSYHVFSNHFIQLKIDSLICINPDETCSLPYKSDYTQVYKYSVQNDGKIEFLNTQKSDSWIDKIVDDYLKNAQNEKLKKAVSANYYIEWLPTETKKIKGDSYTILQVVYEMPKGEKDFDFENYTNKYKLVNTLYIQLPSQKLFEMNEKGKLEEFKF